MTNNKTPKDKTTEEIVMKLDFEVFGLLSDLALAVSGEEVETKVQEIQAIIEDRFKEVRKQIKDQVQAECDEAILSFAKWWSREQTKDKEDYVKRMSLSEAVKQAKTYIKEQREHE